MIFVRIKQLFVAAVMVVSLMGAGMQLTAPTAYAANGGCGTQFLTFPSWFRGLVDTSNCELKQPGKNAPELQGYILVIVLNVLEIALQLVAYISVGFIIYGGFKYLTSPSDSSKIAGGRKTIQNALIGLVISFASIAIVNLITNNVLK